jgi:methylenetetrahydrofolate dehydrogenase (NADP+)/methenyltetrahydrofolate cyclohydrolase
LAILIDGKSTAQRVRDELKARVTEFVATTGVTPGLATVLVGGDPASQVYVRNKIKATEACRMRSIHVDLPDTISEPELLQKIDALNADPAVHGILVQLPLPKQVSSRKILERIDPKKDVDGFHPYNVGLLATGEPGLKPCTPFGVMKLLEHYGISASGKHAVVVGRSNIVGKPMALLLLQADATVTIAHSRTRDLVDHVKRADIVVAAVGMPNFVRGDWIKDGAVVIDVGINRLSDGTLCGDVDFAVAQGKASHITPVPGGVGPMTIAMLLVNTLEAARKQVGT